MTESNSSDHFAARPVLGAEGELLTPSESRRIRYLVASGRTAEALLARQEYSRRGIERSASEVRARNRVQLRREPS